MTTPPVARRSSIPPASLSHPTSPSARVPVTPPGLAGALPHASRAIPVAKPTVQPLARAAHPPGIAPPARTFVPPNAAKALPRVPFAPPVVTFAPNPRPFAPRHAWRAPAARAARANPRAFVPQARASGAIPCNFPVSTPRRTPSKAGPAITRESLEVTKSQSRRASDHRPRKRHGCDSRAFRLHSVTS